VTAVTGLKRSPLLPIFLIVLVDVFGMTLVIPLLAIYAEHFGATPLDATLLVSTYAVCQLVSGPLLGQVSDRIGRKPMLLVSQIGTFLGFLLLARASALWMVYLSRVIDGATAGNLALAQAYISDNTDKSNRAKSFALIGIAFGVGFFVGPSVTAFLAGYGLAAPVHLASALSLTSILCTAFLLPGGAPPAMPSAPAAADVSAAPAGRRVSPFALATFSSYFRRPVLGGLFAQFFCFSFAFATFTSGFALFAERRFSWHGHPFGVREIGMVFAYSGLLGIVIQGGLVGRLVRRFGEPALAVAGFSSMAVAYATLSFSGAIGWLVVASTFAAFGNGITRPVLTSLITQAAGRHEQGVVIGLNQSLMSVAQICAPLLAGTLIGTGRLGLWAAMAALASLAGVVMSRWGSGKVNDAGEGPRDAPRQAARLEPTQKDRQP
jgi:DHA1 family tetracycline resistance protein-like MFS transporter